MPNILQLFLRPVLGMCIEIKIYGAHIIYEWTISHNTAVESLPTQVNGRRMDRAPPPPSPPPMEVIRQQTYKYEQAN